MSVFMVLLLVFVASCKAGTTTESRNSSSPSTAVKTEQPAQPSQPAQPAQPSQPSQPSQPPQPVQPPPPAQPPQSTQPGEVHNPLQTLPIPSGSGPMPAVPKTTKTSPFPGTIILGSPTADSITFSLMSSADASVYIEYGKTAGNYNMHSGLNSLLKDKPLEIKITTLEKDAQYYYRVCHQVSGQTDFSAGTDSPFHTQRAVGSTFSFGVQGDSHPERAGQMYNSDLYKINMNNVKAHNPDFYLTMGDDFGIDKLGNNLNQTTVNQKYVYQRDYLGLTGSPVFLVNGNHEAAARYLLDGTPNNAAVLAAKARTQYYPLPDPGAFYSGDTENVPFIGLLKDYYAWTWGDALFIIIDPYWGSSVPVDTVLGGGIKRSNMWEVTLGEAQYKWFEQTLATSTAKHKFVFTHHVLGTGRGAIEEAGQYEWGDAAGFAKNRPGWDLPIHQLMVKYGVTIFFQGHDHLFARQELDGVTYQEVPNPADNTYTAFNRDAYKSGDILPNAGFLNVTVSADQVKVDYVSSYLAKDETAGKKNGQVTFSYTLK